MIFTEKNKILVSILTHNRLKLLKRCVSMVKSQTYKNFDLLIIDNESTDGTNKYLSTLEGNNIKIINQPNTGSAKGWYSAINYAKQNNYEFIWLMDDDGFPDRNALLCLISNMTDEYACLSSIVVKENKSNEFLFPIPLLDSDKKPKLISLQRNLKRINDCKDKGNNNIVDFAHFFNGSLLSINKIRKIDNVNASYQHHGVEIDFYYRIIKTGKVSSCIDAIHYHPDVTKRSIDIKWIFFYTKNSIIVNLKYLNYPYLRSILIIFKCIYLIVKRNGLHYFLFNFLFHKNIKFFLISIYYGFKKDLLYSNKITFYD
tara:strand:+ start:34 stop:978 length:945 start_codon:yes stop_codon:yes gene_type:complete